eukprot:gi/632945015/ref/XP_007887823.1/ PREDICTED: telomerase reverse transcriptase [Callorhinchus milii]
MSVRFAPNLCSYQPNPTTVTIKNSILWKTLLSRIGDDVMMYLLEHCSLFMLVKPSCCYQLCGVPIYSLITAGTRLPALWLRRRPIRARFNILLKIVQKRIRFHKGFLLKRKRRTLVDRDSCLDARGTTECNKQKWTQIVSVHTRKPAKRAKLDTDIAKDTPRDVSSTGTKVTEVRPLKRLLHDEDKAESPAKKVKRDRSPEGAIPHSTPPEILSAGNKMNESPEKVEVSDSTSIHSTRGGLVEQKVIDAKTGVGCQRKYPQGSTRERKRTWQEGTIAGYKRQAPGTDAKATHPTGAGGVEVKRSWHFMGVQEAVSFGKSVNSESNEEKVLLEGRGSESKGKQAKVAKRKDESGKRCAKFAAGKDKRGTKRAASNEGDDNDHFNPGRSAKHGQSTKCIAKNDYSWDGLNPDGQCRAAVGVSGQAKPSPIPADASDAATVKNVRTWGSVYVERGHIIYCNDNRECLPKSFLLNCLQGCSSGGQRLVEAIFLSSDAFGNNGKKQPNNYWRKRRLPKRYWKMKNVFFRLLRNHKRCPYRLLLNRNCAVIIRKDNSVSCSEGNPTPSVNESNSFSTVKMPCKPDSDHLEVNRVTGGATNLIATQGPVLRRKNLEDHTSVNKSVPGLSCPNDLHLEAETGSLQPSEIPNLRCQHKRPTGIPAGKQKVNKELKVFADFDQTGMASGSDGDLLQLLKHYSSPLQVYRFVRECLLRVISDELWGSNHNKYRFLKNVKKLISLGKYDRFSLSELMWKMRVNDCTWLQLNNGQCSVSPSEHRLREEILSKFLLWLMGTYVVHLLKSFFYITETMFMKNMLFYYRKCVWNKIEKIGIRNHLAKAQLQPLSKEEWARKQRQKTAIPSYALRFIPKRNGLRPIVKMRNITGSKKCVKGSNARKIQYFDSQTKILFSALNYECRRNPGLVGSSVFGLDDIYKAWRQFVLLHLRTDKMRTPYYFVKADVTGAYDTIPHAKLVDVISRVLDPKVQENYCIRRYASIWSNSAGQIRKSFKRQAFTMMDLMPNMKEFVSHLQQQTSLQNAVLVDQGLTLNENSGDLFSHFKQLIVENVIRIQDKYYVQRRGIPQGSILSTLLCSLCYGDMENQLFQGIQKDGLLLRLIDDFLLVTPHLSQAQRFLRMLTAGIPEYGCFIHPNKTMVNFPLDNDLLGCINVKTLQEHCLFPWCGLLLNTQTLEVYCDYSSYANTSITSSLTFNCSSKAGQNLRQKLLAVLKLKCHQIFLDLEQTFK